MRDNVREIKFAIVWGIGSVSREKISYHSLPSHRTAVRNLHQLRDLSVAHWAHAEINGRRVDDDQIRAKLAAMAGIR